MGDSTATSADEPAPGLGDDRAGAAPAFLAAIPTRAPVAIAYHGDADGSASAALMAAFLERTGRRPVALAPGKGIDLYGPEFVARLRAIAPTALVVLDQGSRPRRVLPEVPTLVVDHHLPPGEGVPVEVYVSGLADDPIPTASLLAWRLLAPIENVEDRRWLAALGAIGDLGNDAPFPEVAAAKSAYGGKNLADAVALVNAAKRAATHDTETSLAALLAASEPSDLAKGRLPQSPQLAAYRAEVAAERRRCARVPPRFSGDWALLRFASPCQVHGPVASSWAGRLRKQVVMAANLGYTPGNVHFSVRSARPDIDLIGRLRELGVDPGGGEFGFGHARATGGILPVAAFASLLAAIGFDPALADPSSPG